MGLNKKWSDYKKEKILEEKIFYAVYELADKDKEVLYIGEGQLKTRLYAHLPNQSEPVVTASYYRYELTGWEQTEM